MKRIYIWATLLMLLGPANEATADFIPSVFTNCTPSATVYDGRFYVAYRKNDSDRIAVASTRTPSNRDSWTIEELDIGFPGGPEQIRTSDCPAISGVGGKLWLTFKGHNNPYIWMICKEGGRWYGNGLIRNTQTAAGPALAATMVAHRGNRDRSVWYVDLQAVPHTDRLIPNTSTDHAPAIAYFGRQRFVAYRNHTSGMTMTTHYRHLEGTGWGWTTPKDIPFSRTTDRPGLAEHGDNLYAALKAHDSNNIYLAVYNGRTWVRIQDRIAYAYTSEGPSLVSYGGELYVVHKGHNNDHVWYRAIQTLQPDPSLMVMTVNARIRTTEDHRYQSWWYRLPRIVSMMRSYEAGRGPHIVGMQELESGQYDDTQETWLADGYGSFFYERGGSIFWNRREGLAIFYRTDRLSLLDQGEFTTSDEMRRVAGDCSRDADRDGANRTVVWGRFRDLVTGGTFYVYNTHFPSRNACERMGMAQLMAEEIDRREHDDPFIALGDFNAGQETNGDFLSPYTTLRDSTGIVNSYREVHEFFDGDEFSTVGGYANDRYGKMIDLVLGSPEFQVMDADIDHTVFPPDEGCSPYRCDVYHNSEPIDCHYVSGGRCLDRERRDTGVTAANTVPYSDHWAVWAKYVLIQ